MRAYFPFAIDDLAVKVQGLRVGTIAISFSPYKAYPQS
jgi:hypothetical protein